MYVDNVMMLEADVSLGRLSGPSSSGEIVPIMAHPPHKTSDQTVGMFLDAIVDATRNDRVKKGIKLDFKDMGAVEDTLQAIKAMDTQMNFPLWLNADVLPGPGSAHSSYLSPLNATAFLSLCRQLQPSRTLSLGWTTGHQLIPSAYSQHQLDSMKNLLKGVNLDKVSVTFPVRAANALQSTEALKSFLGHFGSGATLTVWYSNEDEMIAGEELARFVTDIGRDKVYVDVPGPLYSDVQDSLNSN